MDQKTTRLERLEQDLRHAEEQTKEVARTGTTDEVNECWVRAQAIRKKVAGEKRLLATPMVPKEVDPIPPPPRRKTVRLKALQTELSHVQNLRGEAIEMKWPADVEDYEEQIAHLHAKIRGENRKVEGRDLVAIQPDPETGGAKFEIGFGDYQPEQGGKHEVPPRPYIGADGKLISEDDIEPGTVVYRMPKPIQTNPDGTVTLGPPFPPKTLVGMNMDECKHGEEGAKEDPGLCSACAHERQVEFESAWNSIVTTGKVSDEAKRLLTTTEQSVALADHAKRARPPHLIDFKCGDHLPDPWEDYWSRMDAAQRDAKATGHEEPVDKLFPTTRSIDFFALMALMPKGYRLKVECEGENIIMKCQTRHGTELVESRCRLERKRCGGSTGFDVDPVITLAELVESVWHQTHGNACGPKRQPQHSCSCVGPAGGAHEPHCMHYTGEPNGT